jgi:hypothetical protein
VNSIPWKFALSRFHVAEFKRIQGEVFSLPEDQRIFEAVGKLLMRAAGTPEGRSFAETCFRSEAHLIAYAQALHSTADIMAKVLCKSLHLDALFGARERRYLHSVVDRMRSRPELDPIRAAAQTYLDSPEFRYLRAYVNTTKHQSLVPTGYVVAFDEERHDLKIGAFSDGGDTWPEKWAGDFIGPELEHLSRLFGEIGCKLNNHLGFSVTASS